MPSKRSTVPVACAHCGGFFYPWTTAAFGPGDKGRFCSRVCSHKGAQRRVIARCQTCSAQIELRPSEIASNYGRFCSRACAFSSTPISAPLPGPDENTLRIPLWARDRRTIKGYAVIDATDTDRVKHWNWTLDRGYARRMARIDGKLRPMFLHRVILGLTHGDGLDGDHIDRDTLNNRRTNLRIVPKGANPQNQSSQRGSTSKYRGVCWDKKNGRWMANVYTQGKRHWLGYFDDEVEAAAVARAARLRLMPYAID